MASMTMKVLCVVVVCMVVVTPCTVALTCKDVTKNLSPCLSYLQGGNAASKECCNGVKGLQSAVVTRHDKKMACKCMKKAFKKQPNIKSDNAVALPSNCSVNFPYKISLDTDCNKYKL
ncbi:non-specific lipid-transfer protein Lac s 1-like [Rutidosis leptorrhynchoides]|uniref:non-specific lipid-transfer protein Lac s 1-like n=1 Tax=Rutidosis leptorrhynchoides TaxID=125765 RepID=UPI003A991869